MRTILSFILIGAGCVAVGGCRDAAVADSAAVRVVATTPQVANFARAVGGERVAVTQILSPGSDPHEYEPRPSDAEALVDADLIVRSGGDVDGWLDQVIEAADGGAPELTLSEETKPRLDSNGDTDPHWWQDPRNAELAVAAIAARLATLDPAGAAGYRRRAGTYLARLRALDRAIATCMGAIPSADRELVSGHDALGYYADRYGIEFVGAAIPALSTQAQPSARAVDELVDAIRGSGATSVFAEAGSNADLEAAIADEAGAQLGGELWTDTLGPPGSDGATYLDAMRSNTIEIAAGLSDGRVSCDAEFRP